MLDWLEFKQQLNREIANILAQKLGTLKEAIAQARQGLNAESKSSAGDKHETGRAMVQLELEKLGQQLKLAEVEYDKAQGLSAAACKTAKPGAFIELDNQYLYWSVSLGKISLNKMEVFVISSSAPLAQALAGKTAGEKINFRGREMKIERIA